MYASKEAAYAAGQRPGTVALYAVEQIAGRPESALFDWLSEADIYELEYAGGYFYPVQ